MTGPPNNQSYISCDGNNFCCEIGLSNAADALKNFLPGESGKIVWAIGLLAAGQASTMTGTFAGQFVMEGFIGWRVAPWVRVAITRAISLGPAIAVGIISSSNATAGDTLNEWLNILQSVQLPFALLPVLHFTSSKRLMGEFANGGTAKFAAWVLAMAVVIINFYLVVTFIADPHR